MERMATALAGGTLVMAMMLGCSRKEASTGTTTIGTTPSETVKGTSPLYSGPPPAVCTAATCAAGAAQCPGSPNGVCTPTEALVLKYDVQVNHLGPGPAASTSCYGCMVKNACLDSTPAASGLPTPVTNAECGDPNGANHNAPFDSLNGSAANVAACLDVLGCVLNGNNASAPFDCTKSQTPPSVSNCFCGSATGAACIASPVAPKGVCASKEYADLGIRNPTELLARFTDPTNPGGVGNQVLNCALIANCNACFR